MRFIYLVAEAHPLWTICLYGVVAAVLFITSGTVRNSTYANCIYLVGFFGLNIFMASARPVTFTDPVEAVVQLLTALASAVIGALFNAVALKYSLGQMLTAFGRALTGDDQIKWRKTYDRAEAADKRGDTAAAAAIYRDELRSDPRDTEAHRRLGELLVRMGRPQEAAGEYRTVIELSEGEQRGAAAFRLAEILQDELGDSDGARAIYETIVRERPQSGHAEYARARLGTAPDVARGPAARAARAGERNEETHDD